MTFVPFDALSTEKADDVICMLQIIEELSQEGAYRRFALKELNLLMQTHGIVADEIIFAAIIHTHMGKRQKVEETPDFDTIPDVQKMRMWSQMFSEAKLLELVAEKEGRQLTDIVVKELNERFEKTFRKLSEDGFCSEVFRIELHGGTTSREIWKANIFRIPSL